MSHVFLSEIPTWSDDASTGEIKVPMEPYPESFTITKKGKILEFERSEESEEEDEDEDVSGEGDDEQDENDACTMDKLKLHGSEWKYTEKQDEHFKKNEVITIESSTSTKEKAFIIKQKSEGNENIGQGEFATDNNQICKATIKWSTGGKDGNIELAMKENPQEMTIEKDGKKYEFEREGEAKRRRNLSSMVSDANGSDNIYSYRTIIALVLVTVSICFQSAYIYYC